MPQPEASKPPASTPLVCNVSLMAMSIRVERSGACRMIKLFR